MFWPLLTLTADAYPLIWPAESVAEEPQGICHWDVPGCWFSSTTGLLWAAVVVGNSVSPTSAAKQNTWSTNRSEEHTSELQSLTNLVCRLLLEKKKKKTNKKNNTNTE